jgi:alkaline phosphatase D
MASRVTGSGPNRRQILEAAGAIGAVLAWPSPSVHASARTWKERRDLYPEGVASGDPAPDSIILWTRRPPAGGKPAPKLTLEIAEDESFRRVVSVAEVLPKAENDWTVRVLATGLKPARIYWYRFIDPLGQGSRVGRTRTAPGDDDGRPVSFAFVSCQQQNAGANNAYRRMIYEDIQKPEAEQLGFVLHLGDFIYELVWYPEDRPKGYYSRRLREVVRYPKGRKVADYHIPIDLDDYRAAWRGYLADPDLEDARARWPFICMWDNHEFSWQGFQGLTDDGKGVVGAQTRRVAAAQAWFEYQPSRATKAGGGDWNHFDAPKVADVNVTAFNDEGIVTEPNNLTAIRALRLYRQFRYGRNVDLILTDNRSFCSYLVFNDKAAEAFDTPDFLGAVPLEAMEILDAGKSYNGGNPPDSFPFGAKSIPNYRKDKEPQSILGAEQKAWFLERLKTSSATWKVWGNSVGSLDARIDLKNLPEGKGKWPGKDYGMLTVGDWSGYRSERGEILDFVKANGITGLTSVCGDRHAFYAGYLSKSLPPESYEPVALEFVGTSISSVGACEAFEYKMPDSDPLHALLVRRPRGKPAEPMVNMSIMHGVRTSLAYDKDGDLKAALALSNPEVAPHLAFVDLGGHGYSVVRATSDALVTEFVCIPRPLERSKTPDGGPLLYRIRHRARAWKVGEKPALEQELIEGTPPLWAA